MASNPISNRKVEAYVPTQADRRMAFGAGLFRVGMLVFIVGTALALFHSSVLAKAAASGGGAAALVGMVLALIARSQGGRIPPRRR